MLAIAIFPVLTGAFAMLMLDRYVGTNFFTNDLGGNPMMYWNLVWIWGHPEVYVLILPVFGIYSEITSTFCGKRLFGYSSMVYATVVITILSYLVWLHHFFTMGSGASVNSFFGIATMVISIPTGREDLQLAVHHVPRRIRFELPMMWVVAFMLTFVVGGMTGVLLAVPPADFVLHNSLFLVAHFHNVIIGGVVFGLFAGHDLLVPQGVRLQARPVLGQGQLLGLGDRLLGRLDADLHRRPDGHDAPGAPVRRSDACRSGSSSPAIGALIILVGILAFVIQIAVSIMNRDAAARYDRRPVGRPHAGMVDLLAAAALQLRLHAGRPRPRRLVRHEERAATQRPADGLPADPHAAQHRHRRDPGRARHRARLRDGLVHLVAGGARLRRPDRGRDRAHFNYNRDYYIPADEVARTEASAHRRCWRREA